MSATPPQKHYLSGTALGHVPRAQGEPESCARQLSPRTTPHYSGWPLGVAARRVSYPEQPPRGRTPNAVLGYTARVLASGTGCTPARYPINRAFRPCAGRPQPELKREFTRWTRSYSLRRPNRLATRDQPPRDAIFSLVFCFAANLRKMPSTGLVASRRKDALSRRFGGLCPQIRNRHWDGLPQWAESFEFGSPNCMIP